MAGQADRAIQEPGNTASELVPQGHNRSAVIGENGELQLRGDGWPEYELEAALGAFASYRLNLEKVKASAAIDAAKIESDRYLLGQLIQYAGWVTVALIITIGFVGLISIASNTKQPAYSGSATVQLFA